MTKEDYRFKRWLGTDASGRNASPISLLIRGALRYTVRGFTFDDICEGTNISEETHRFFYHVFIDCGSTFLFEKFIKTPKCSEDVTRHQQDYDSAGFTGAVGSADAVHIILEICTHRLKQAHLSSVKILEYKLLLVFFLHACLWQKVIAVESSGSL